MTKIDRPEAQDRVVTIDDEKKRALDLWDVRLMPPDVGIFDEPTRCYRINKHWAAIVMGMVSWLAELPVWVEAEHEGYSAIEEIQRFLVGNDCMSQFQLRQKPGDFCILQQSLDGGSTWVDAFDFSLCEAIQDGSNSTTQVNNFYTNNFQTFQNNVYNHYVENYVSSVTDIHPELGYGDSDDEFRDDALCFALGKLIDSVCIAANEFFEGQAQTANDLQTSLAIAGAVIGIIALAASGVGTPAAALLATQAGLWAAGIGIGTALGSALYDHYLDTNQAAYNDGAAREELLCCLYGELQGANVDHADLIAAFSCTGLSANAQAIHDAAAILVNELATYAAFTENMAIGFQSAKLGLLPSCPCTTSEGYTADFTLGIPTNWEIKNGTFVSGQGIQSVATSDGAGTVNVLLTIPSGGTFSPLNFSVEYERQSDGSFNDDLRIIGYISYAANTGRTNWYEYDEPIYSNSVIIHCPVPPPSPVARQQWLVSLRDNNPSNTMRLKRIRFWSPMPLPTNSLSGCL